MLSFIHPKDSVKTTEISLKIPGKVLSASDSSEGFEKSVKTFNVSMETTRYIDNVVLKSFLLKILHQS